MSSSSDDTQITGTTGDYLTSGNILFGSVKWFNNKAGYGFITTTDNDKKEYDIFVHHSAIKVENQQYKYLVQGEYVQFKLVSVEDGKHQYHASEVTGINLGKLMCETRRELLILRNNYKNVKDVNSDDQRVNTGEIDLSKTIRLPRSSRVRGEGPRDSQQGEWTVKEKKRKPYVKTQNKVSQV